MVDIRYYIIIIPIIIAALFLSGCSSDIVPLSERDLGSAGPQSVEEAVSAVYGDEIVFEGYDALFRVERSEVVDTPTHYEFRNSFVSTNFGEDWRPFDGKARLSKDYYKERDK